ncbi:hypothetical protein ABENE_17605 [Asticcacaulis benevestitus DSM 16100 = ATCC BAA-896]|uniref:Uncharacterized protein n=1 Tax=Asticcacaulis benevestitus DSM 16100 = ATCC BAA-896 TaxID=1121022 RepID=V4PIJ1_9CAUL|nr:hypothetical protein ABENE_17605 [Asticcacaulis benevestitus DSM 16100 = ATCC BAA-896]
MPGRALGLTHWIISGELWQLLLVNLRAQLRLERLLKLSLRAIEDGDTRIAIGNVVNMKTDAKRPCEQVTLLLC